VLDDGDTNPTSVVEELPPLHELNTVETITSPQKPMTICAFG